MDEEDLKALRVSSISETLELFNNLGEELFLRFKKGSNSYQNIKKFCEIKEKNPELIDNNFKKNDNVLTNFRIECLFSERNKHSKEKQKKNTILIGGSNGKRDSVVTGCLSYYSFSINYDDEKNIFYYKVISCNDIHNHENKKLEETSLSEEMRNELKAFTKQISYSAIFNEFRKIYPRFNKNDAEELIKKLKYKGFYFKYEMNTNDSLKNIIFLSGKMRKTYELFGKSGIMMIDTTYKNNKYNLPLCNFCGTDNNGHNLIFAHAFIYNELQETFDWLFNQFIELMHNKMPKVIISDQDLALTASINCNFLSSTTYCVIGI